MVYERLGTVGGTMVGAGLLVPTSHQVAREINPLFKISLMT